MHSQMHSRQMENLRIGNRRPFLNELEFLEKEGFSKYPGMPRLRSLFQDGPNCPRGDEESQIPCEACPWFRFVPAAFRMCNVPCHLIPLNAAGETAASLAQGDRRRQLEVYRDWLLRTLQRIDNETDT